MSRAGHLVDSRVEAGRLEVGPVRLANLAVHERAPVAVGEVAGLGAFVAPLEAAVRRPDGHIQSAVSPREVGNQREVAGSDK